MNKHLVIASMMLVVVAPNRVSAQSAEGAKPSEPVLKRAPSHAEWTVYFHQDRQKTLEAVAERGLDLEDSKSAKGASRSESLTVTKNGKTYREILRTDNGRTSEKWSVDGLQVYELPSGRIAQAILPSSGYADNYTDYRRSDFEELEWVGLDNFRGTKEVGGRKVFEFRIDASKRRLTPRELTELATSDERQSVADLLKERAAQSGGSAYTAYLDVRTQLPLYFDDGEVVRIYKFSEHSSSDLTVPSRFAEELQSWKKDLARRRPLPPP